MAHESPSRSPLTRVYHDRIGETSTADEPTGYWLFALGLILGGLGILLYLPSTASSTLREWAIVLAASGLALLVAGPLIRIPLQRAGSWLVAIGLVACTVGILWFTMIYPGSAFRTGADPVIATYAGGILVMALGGIFVPLVTTRAQIERDSLDAEVQGLRSSLDRSEATEAELARTLAQLREGVLEADDSHAALDRINETLQRNVAASEADQENLATRLRTLHRSDARFELYEDTAGEYHWRLRHRNGDTIARSADGFPSRASAQRRLQSVRHNALGASLLFHETETDLPSTTETFEPVGESESGASFSIEEDGRGHYRYQLLASDGNRLAESAHAYPTTGAARAAIERIQQYASPADYLRFDPTGIEIYRDQSAEWRWRLVHRNGEILADSGEGYASRANAQRAVDRLRDTAPDANFEVFEDAAGEYRWRVRTRNGKIVADSGEGYTERNDAEEAVDRVREYAPAADLLDIGLAAFEITADADDVYHWRLRHRNGSVLAESTDGYASRGDVYDAIERVKRQAPGADMEE
jgi:uncharacterized protein YegP (UPF0339 family)